MQRTVRRKHLALVAGLALAVLAAVPASASTFLAMDVPELVNQSDAVVTGTVIALRSQWDEERTFIYTDVLVAVEEAVAGETPRNVWIRTFGGEVGDYRVEAIGFPRFDEGDRVLLFLNQRHGVDDTIRVTGHQLGHYRVVDRGGVEMAVPTVDGSAAFITKSGQAAITPRERVLNELKAEIDILANRAPQQR